MGLIASKDVVNEADESVVTIELENTTPIVGIEIRPIVNLKALHACVFRWERLPSAAATPRTDIQGVFPFNAETVKKGEITLLASSISYIPTQFDVGHKLRFSCTLLSSITGITKYTVTDICIPLPMNPPPRKWAYYEVKSNVVPMVPSTPTMEHLSATSIGGMSGSVSSAVASPSFVSLSPTPNHLQMLQHNISNVSTYIQTNFVVLTYNMMLVGEQPTKRLRKQYATCPSYALSFVYRKKLLLRELLSYRADIMCLQQVESLGREYWDVELSKEGYSGFSDFEFEKTNSSVLLYKRSKFTKVKDWQVRFLDEFSLCFDALKSSSFADPIFKYFHTYHLSGDKCDQARSLLGKQIALVCLLELKDVAMMREEAEHGKYDSFGKVLVINVHSQKQKATNLPPGKSLSTDDKLLAEKVQLLQVYLLVRKITFILDEVGVRIPVIIAGSFDSTCSSLFYKMLSNGHISLEPNLLNSYASSLVKHTTAAELSPPTTSENHADEISTETENDEKQLLSTHRTTEVRQVGSEIKLPFAMKSAYKQVQGHEPTFFLSTADNAKSQVEDFIWYTSSDLEAKRVCKIPQTQSFPNVDFVSNHVALLAELDLVQLNGKEDDEVGYSSGEDQEADSMEGLEMN